MKTTWKSLFIFIYSSSLSKKTLIFFFKKYDACAVGAPYFSKSFGTTFQSYFREDKKLILNFTTHTMIFQNKTAKKLFLTWRTEREINFLKY